MESPTPATHKAQIFRFPPLKPSLEFEELFKIIQTTICRSIDSAYSFEQLSTPPVSSMYIRPLVLSLVHANSIFATDDGQESSGRAPDYVLQPSHHFSSTFKDLHRGIVAALLIARIEFMSRTYGFLEGIDHDDYVDENDGVLAAQYMDKGVSKARAYTAEIIASRFIAIVTSEIDRIEFLTYEPKPYASRRSGSSSQPETAPLLSTTPRSSSLPDLDSSRSPIPSSSEEDSFMDVYRGCNVLELAFLGDAKKFLSTGPVESILVAIWCGRVVFWKEINSTAAKKPHLYDDPYLSARPLETRPDLYTRLRVPRYRTFFMMVNYAILLGLFYGLLFRQHASGDHIEMHVSWIEILLHIWFAGFILEEVMQVWEASSIVQYVADYWSLFDVGIIGIFLIFAIIRIVGYIQASPEITDFAFDILSLEALILVPRLFSFLSIFPYFGTLLPCLKALSKEFLKFLSIILIIYVGFLTTFTFLGRGVFSFNQMAWLLVRVFFGSSYAGFDAAPQISEIFGPALMLVFITLTNILLVTVLISILSQRFSLMMTNAREEYILMFCSTVVESMSNFDRVTYFYPPLNLIGLGMRPLRLVLTKDQYRTVRIKVLKLTHWPFVACLWTFERALAWYARQRRVRNYPFRQDVENQKTFRQMITKSKAYHNISPYSGSPWKKKTTGYVLFYLLYPPTNH